jgi:catechol 2,3-dioxygenase-like lactoylglutathione lyase family enzyme
MSMPGPLQESHPARGLRRVQLGSHDLERSADFYRGLLGFEEVPVTTAGPRSTRLFSSGTVHLEIVAVDDEGDLGGWVNDDLQGGIRHFGMKVGDVDRQIRRLEAAGVTVISAPTDVLGGVRIAFFLDPDGARLEFIEGNLAYQHVSSQTLAAAEAATRLAPDDGPRFDHVALTVPDLPSALRFWCDRMGFEVIGNIRHQGDPRGFLMTYLQAGPAVLEVFSFDVPVSTHDLSAEDASVLGFRSLGLAVEEAPATAGPLLAPGGVPVTFEEGP